MSKVRVYEVARDLGMDNKSLVALFQSVGVSEVRNHMSAVAPEAVERVKRHLEKGGEAKAVEERIAPTVVKRRSSRKREEPAREVAESSPEAARPSVVRRRAEPTPPPEAPKEEASAEAKADKHVEEADQAPAPVPPPAPAQEEQEAAATAPAELPKPPKEEAVATAQQEPAPQPEPVEKPAAAAAPAAEPAPTPKPVAEAKKEPQPAPEEAPAPAAKTEPAAPPAAKPEESAAEQKKPAPGKEQPEEKKPAAAAAAPEREPASKKPQPAAAPQRQAPAAPRPSSPPKTGIDVWEGRPGVPMPQPPRGPTPRRVQYDAKAGGPMNRRGPGGRPGRGPRHRGIGSLSRGRGQGQPVTQERSAHKKVVRIEESISLQALAGKMGVKATELLMKLIGLGMTGVNINSTLDAETAKLVGGEFGWDVEDVAVSEEEAIVAAQGLEIEDDEADKRPRPPVVTVMGHVDHGKTSLLDKIRKANVVSGEAGGITQHIGAYAVEGQHGTITFLDTPGHEAFTAMRARGAQATDVVVLVCAADDGVMPQTKEAVNHSRAAGVPIVVAINKIDKPDSQPERVRRELSELGLVPEEWGGDTLFTEVSAMTGEGIDNLLEQIVLQAEVLELKANPDKPGVGIVVEAELDRGKGPLATVLITDGTLNQGDVVLAGGAYGKVRAMLDSTAKMVTEAGPSTPVAVIGLNDVPSAGDPVHVVRDLKKAQEIAETRKTKERRSMAAPTGGPRMSLEDLARAMQEAEQLDLKIIIKADVQGSVEALAESIGKLSTQKVKVSVVHSAVGAITEGDVNLAVAAGAIIIGFNVRPAGKASSLAQQETVEIRQYSVIYNVVDDIKAAMEGLLAPTIVEKTIGKAEVRQLFRITRAGVVAGCMAVDGVLRRTSMARVVRGGAVLWTGKLSSLKRFKEDVREVKEGFECGISLEGYNDLKEGDFIEAFEHEEVKQTL